MGIIEYFTYLTGLIPTEDQKNLLLNLVDINKRKIIISAGRQSGKTLCCAVATLWFVFESGMKVKILLISAQDNILYFHIREIFKNHLELEPQIVAQGTYSIVPLRGFELTNGNQVFVRGSTDKQVRGIPSDIVIIDEAADVKNDIVLTALGNLSGNISKICLVSTPHVLNSIFVKWASDTKSGFELHQWSSEGLPWHNIEIDKLKKKEYAASKYAIEMLGRVPSIGERSFFNRSHLDKCWFEHINLEGGPSSYIWIGIDWGFDPCKTVITIVEKLFSRRRVLLQRAWHKKPIEDYAPELIEILSKFPNAITKADSKPVEYKEYMDRNYPKTKIHYLDGVQHKDQELEQLQRHVRQHTLELSDVEIFKQLCIYKKGMRTGDLVDSLALASYEPNIPLVNRPVGSVVFSNKKT